MEMVGLPGDSFVPGIEYPREHLLEFVGSKQGQTGIIWGDKEDGCVIVTSGGRHGMNAGYGDHEEHDGTWVYYGQGGTGDQDPGKFSNKLLVDRERSVLLFTTREPTAKEAKLRGSYKKLYRYKGAFQVASWDYFTPHSGKRKGDKLIRFRLVPVIASFDTQAAGTYSVAATKMPLVELRKQVYEDAKSPVKTRYMQAQFMQRERLLRGYVRLRANGTCELCRRPAPFKDKEGIPFLEVHHIHRLADGGTDSPLNVAGMCPNCHREAHLGNKRQEIKAILQRRVASIENDLGSIT